MQMLKSLLLISILLAGISSSKADEVDWSLPLNYEGIFILGESDKEVLEQCARDPIQAKFVWRPTFEQVKFIDIRLRKHLKETQSNFKVLPKKLYHRQYIGYTDETGESIYINVYPVPKNSKINESRTPIVSCDKSRLYWGISFSIESFKFSEIEFNSRLVIPIQEPNLK